MQNTEGLAQCQVEGMEERERVEQDTDDIEEIENVLAFLLPPGDVPSDCRSFGVLYNKRVLDGWVKQPSACCGAASLAGAWNALSGLHRRAEEALSHETVLAVYRSMFLTLLEGKQRSFERRLGAPIDQLLRGISTGLRALGRTIGGAKEAGAQRKAVMAVLQDMARAHMLTTARAPSAEVAEVPVPVTSAAGSAAAAALMLNSEGAVAEFHSYAPEQAPARSAIECLIELYLAEGVDLASPRAGTGTGAGTGAGAGAGAGSSSADRESSTKGDADDEDKEKDEEGEGEGDGDTAATDTKTSSARPNASTSTSAWDWRKDFMAIVKNIEGFRKLSAARPSTAAIGNWAILKGSRLMAERHSQPSLGTSVTCKLFLGKQGAGAGAEGKLPVPLSGKDGPEEVEQQWGALRSAFARPDTVLLYHLKNHYALVFALREWTTTTTTTSAGAGAEAPVPVRQLLTARKGQRPTAWVDFAEVRRTLIAYPGYKIMALQRTVSEAEMGTSRQTQPELSPLAQQLAALYVDL